MDAMDHVIELAAGTVREEVEPLDFAKSSSQNALTQYVSEIKRANKIETWRENREFQQTYNKNDFDIVTSQKSSSSSKNIINLEGIADEPLMNQPQQVIRLDEDYPDEERVSLSQRYAKDFQRKIAARSEIQIRHMKQPYVLSPYSPQNSNPIGGYDQVSMNCLYLHVHAPHSVCLMTFSLLHSSVSPRLAVFRGCRKHGSLQRKRYP